MENENSDRKQKQQLLVVTLQRGVDTDTFGVSNNNGAMLKWKLRLDEIEFFRRDCSMMMCLPFTKLFDEN